MPSTSSSGTIRYGGGGAQTLGRLGDLVVQTLGGVSPVPPDDVVDDVSRSSTVVWVHRTVKLSLTPLHDPCRSGGHAVLGDRFTV